jgi:hypothetical protein
MTRRTLTQSILALSVALLASPATAGVTASYRYPLSNFSGPVLSQWAKLAVDPERNEVYALHQRKHDIRIFDEHGMEIFVFAEGFGSAADIAIGDDGDIFVLSQGYQSAQIHLLNYRGEEISLITPQGLPDTFSGFVPDRIVYQDKSLYLVDSDAMKVVVADAAGRFEKGYDLSREIKPLVPQDKFKRELSINDWRKRQLESIGLNGFTVDHEGNLFFTVPVLFSAFRLSASGELTAFGRSGSSKGKFGVVAGIATDDMGYVYVADRLRSVVLVFDPRLEFETEFGYRGNQPSNLIVPDDVAVDGNGNVYVGQAANRGVSVFKIVHQDSIPPQSDAAVPTEATKTLSIQVEGAARSIDEVEVDRPDFVVDRESDRATDSGSSDQNNGAVGPQNNEVENND